MKILWLKTGPLHPLDTGGKLRTYNMLRVLSQRHEVTYLSLCPRETKESVKRKASEYCSEAIWVPWSDIAKTSPIFPLAVAWNVLTSRNPYAVDKYVSAEMVTAIRTELSRSTCDIFVCDFLAPSLNLLKALPDCNLPTLLFQHNVEAMIWERLSAACGNPLKRLFLRQQASRMRAYEKRACQACDGVVAVSEEDCRVFRERYALPNVLGAVPTGVDSDYFAEVSSRRAPLSIVFLGSMDWLPNVDAAEYFLAEIFPRIKASEPEASLVLVGRNPTANVLRLVDETPGVTATGTVPDVRPYLASAQVCVVPLRAGGGTRIKIFEAMAAGVPVVSTHIGAEGLPVTHEQTILLADPPDQFADQVLRVLRDEALRERLSATALDLVRRKHSWSSVADQFEEMCRDLKSCL